MTDFPFNRHSTLPFPHVTGYWVNRLGHAFRTYVDRELKDVDLTRRQAGMLGFIHRAENPVASDLTRALGIDSTAVTRMLARLEDKGLVERTQDPDDGRRLILSLTPAARRLLPKLMQKADRVEGTFEADVDPEDLATFHSVLMKMLSNVDQDHFALLEDV